jgi:hypothetical protein
MENESSKDQLKRSAAPSGKEGLKLASLGDLEVRELAPLHNSEGSVQIDGTVTFNDTESFTVVYPQPTAVIPGQSIGPFEPGNLTKFQTDQVGGGSTTVYLYYTDSSDGRQYFESPSPSGSPSQRINTQTVHNEFLIMELRLITIDEVPIIVVGTIIIETGADGE